MHHTDALDAQPHYTSSSGDATSVRAFLETENVRICVDCAEILGSAVGIDDDTTHTILTRRIGDTHAALLSVITDNTEDMGVQNSMSMLRLCMVPKLMYSAPHRYAYYRHCIRHGHY